MGAMDARKMRVPSFFFGQEPSGAIFVSSAAAAVLSDDNCDEKDGNHEKFTANELEMNLGRTSSG